MCGGAQMGDTCELSVQAAAALCGEGEELSYWQLMVRLHANESLAGNASPVCGLQRHCMYYGRMMQLITARSMKHTYSCICQLDGTRVACPRAPVDICGESVAVLSTVPCQP